MRSNWAFCNRTRTSRAFVVDDSDWVEKLDYIQTARIPLEGTFQEYWDAREGRLRKNNDRLRRRMAEKGLDSSSSTFAILEAWRDAIRELARLESKGWKAKEGTAVGVDNAQGRFYRAVLEDFCAPAKASSISCESTARLSPRIFVSCAKKC